MWPTLTEKERKDIGEAGEQGKGWSVLTWRKSNLPQGMMKRWERKSTLMPGQSISRKMGWWKTGDPVATKTKDHLDLWAPKGVE
eukprot:480488-Rhodomonas_salina.1